MTPQNCSKRMFETLDGMRGIAAIFVLMRHFPYAGALTFDQSYLAVDLFFLLSGIVLSNAYDARLETGLSAGKFVWMRIVRIYPMYYFGCLISISLWLYGGYPALNLNFLVIIFAIFCVPNIFTPGMYALNGPAWSLFIEMVANILYAAFHKFINSKNLFLIISLSAVLCVAVLFRYRTLDVGWTRSTLLAGLPRVGFSFFLGISLYRIYRSKSSPLLVSKYAPFMPWFCVTIVTLILTASPSAYFRPFFDFFAIIIVLPVIIYASLYFIPDNNSKRIFAWLGVISFPMYTIHAPVIKWMTVFATPGVVRSSQDVWWMEFLFIAALIPICIFLEKFYDLPLRKKILGMTGGVLGKVRSLSRKAS